MEHRGHVRKLFFKIHLAIRYLDTSKWRCYQILNSSHMDNGNYCIHGALEVYLIISTAPFPLTVFNYILYNMVLEGTIIRNSC
jgi:hypothetical protein